MDPKGKIWAVPYRWGSLVIMYKKSKFKTHGIPPIQVYCRRYPSFMGDMNMFSLQHHVYLFLHYNLATTVDM